MSADPSRQSALDKWTILRTGPKGAGALEVPSLPIGATAESGQLRAAVGPNGEARLLLPLATDDHVVGIDAGNALSVCVSSFVQSGRATRFLDLTCHSRELEPVFSEVVDTIVSRVSDGSGCPAAVRTSLNDFRALLVAKHPKHVDRSQVIGLLAELLVLNRLLDVSPAAWRAWKGPSGDRHDFRAGSMALEVKASGRASTASIAIHGMEQLELPSDGSLHLAHFTLEASAGGMLTVAALGTSALGKSDDPESLSELLSSIGCADVESTAWNNEAFRVESEHLYRVGPEFPRLVPSMLRDLSALRGIRDVSYKVELSTATDCRCTAGELESLLRALAQTS